MTADSFELALQIMRQRVPFQPFTIALVNGDRLEVDHLDALMVRESLAIFFAPGKVPQLFDHEGVAQLIGDLMNANESIA